MKKAGYTLVVLAFLGSAFLAALDAREVNWLLFIPLLAVGFVGVFLVALAERRHARSEKVINANRADLDGSLSRIVANLDALNQRRAAIPPYEMRFEIDQGFREDLTRFAEARETLGHIYGLRAYAEIMSPFAAGERYLNRVWSASADGYAEEVSEYLVRAEEQFREAQVKLEEAHRQAN